MLPIVYLSYVGIRSRFSLSVCHSPFWSVQAFICSLLRSLFNDACQITFFRFFFVFFRCFLACNFCNLRCCNFLFIANGVWPLKNKGLLTYLLTALRHYSLGCAITTQCLAWSSFWDLPRPRRQWWTGSTGPPAMGHGPVGPRCQRLLGPPLSLVIE